MNTATHTPQPRHHLGQTAAWITPVSFGAASLGNLYRETTDEDSNAAIESAWAGGIRSFDTAPHYGLGLSERRLGHALAAYPRSELQVSTKVGRLLVPNPHPTGQDDGFAVPDDHTRVWDFTRDGVLRSLEASLDRLGLDRVDTVFAHDPDCASPGAAEEALTALAELRDQGVVSAIGIGTNDTAGLAGFIREGLLDVIMLAGRYTLLEQHALDSVLEPALAANVSIIAVGVYNSGLLASDRPASNAMYNYLPAPPEMLARAHQIAALCEARGVSLSEAALAFPFCHPAVAGVALGMRNGAQVTQNLERFAAKVPDELWADLASAGLVDQRALASKPC